MLSVWPGASESPGEICLPMLVGTGLDFFKLSLSGPKWATTHLRLPVLTEHGRDKLLLSCLRISGLSSSQAQAAIEDQSLAALLVDTQGIPGPVVQLGTCIAEHVNKGFTVGRCADGQHACQRGAFQICQTMVVGLRTTVVTD